jgi:coenzyme F420 hydrogenase subunit beta
MNKLINYVDITQNNLCHGCGTCESLCPQNAIKLVMHHQKGIYLPTLNNNKCNNCGICKQVCPGWNVDFEKLNFSIFGNNVSDVYLGTFLNCYSGYSCDGSIRFHSTSGGVITQLLIFALERGMIDGALITRMNHNIPTEPEPFIATTKEEIIDASNSKYCPVPTNIVLNKILNQKGRYAFVGLPCHIHGIRKAEQMNNVLKERLVLHLGLFCDHVPNNWATKIYLQRLNIKSENINKLEYRGDGWPGSMKISTINGDIIQKTNSWDFIGLNYFSPARCLVCCDHTSELSDLSFGDAWLPEFKKDTQGQSIIISRSNFGENLLKMAYQDNVLNLNQIGQDKVRLSQKAPLYFKKKRVSSIIKLFKVKPIYNTKLLPSNIFDDLLSIFPLINYKYSENKILRPILKFTPTSILKLNRYIYSLLVILRLKTINFGK